MKILPQLLNKIWIVLFISIGLGGNLKLENNNDGTWNVLYESEFEITSFQFDVGGDSIAIDSAYGGAAEAAGFILNVNSPMVSGEKNTESTNISDSFGDILVILKLTGEPIGLINMEFFGSDGSVMVFSFIWEGCPDEIACNYDENATINNGNGSCLYPCSTPDGCEEIDSNFDCGGNCIVGLDCVGVCGGDANGVEICTGCMDDGYQQWSPNWGSPACNYAQFAIIEGECLYNDCNGDCGGTASEDCASTCRDQNDENWDYSCLDCNGIINGSAYYDACDQCVGGDTGNQDCLKIDLSFGGYIESNSTDTIKVFVTNLDTLKSLDIEFQIDNSIINIKDFSFVGTALYNIGYEIDYHSFIEGGNFTIFNFILYYEPHPNPETDPELFSPDGKENIFNIVIEAMDINADITTQLIINEFTINEVLMGESNWEGGEILVVVPIGCTDELACNYDPNAREEDGSCEYEIDCSGECGGDAVYDVCEVCDGNETNSDNCTCTEEDSEYDCNGDCPPIEGCGGESLFTLGCAFKDPNCNDICVGGATERYPCQQDCTGEWGGTAYEDNCEQCIADSNDIDCFNSSFQIYNSNGVELSDLIIKEADTIYVGLQMQNLPNSLEGIILNIDYNSSDLFLNNWSLNPEELNLEGELNGELNNTNELYVDIDSTFNDSTIFTAVMYTTNELYEGNGGNMLFLQFINVGDNGDSTYVNYNKVQINEHVMQEQNYTSQVIYFGDCYGVFNGATPLDECGVCGGPGILEGACNCEGNTATDLYGEGYNCDGELSLSDSVIPQHFILSQNYPNPFNPVTYIHYSVPQYDFVTINIVNISGQIIKTIVQSSHQPGNYEIMWNGTNQNGISVPSGIYFYKMDADEFVSVRKLVLLK